MQDYRGAIVQLKNAVGANPESAEVRFVLGNAYIKAHQYENADKELRKAIELGFDESKVIPNLAVALIRSESVNALLKLEFKDKGLSDDELAQVGFYQVQSLAELGRYIKASILIKEISKLDSNSVYMELTQSYAKIIRAEYITALNQVSELRDENPLNEDVIRVTLRLLLGLEKRVEAKEVFEALLQIRPDDNKTKFTYIAMLMDMQDYNTAKPIIEELLGIFEDNVLLQQMLGVVYTGEGKFEEALNRLEFALKYGMDTDITRLMAGYSAYRVSDFETAAKHLGFIRDKMHAGHPALRILAHSQLMLGESDAAAKTLLKVDGKNEKDLALYTRVSDQLIQTGNHVAAKEFVEKSSDLAESGKELLQVGVLELSLNDIKGLTKLEEAAQKLPESVITKRALGKTYLGVGDFEKAMELAQRWKESEPEEPYAFILAIDTLILKKEFEAASYELAGAREIDSDNPYIELASARIDIAREEFSKAKAKLKAISDAHPSFLPAYKLLYSLADNEKDIDNVLTKAKAQLVEAPNTALKVFVAQIFFDSGNYSQVLKILEDIESNRVAPKEYWQLKGQALLNARKNKLAELHYEIWAKLMPYDVGAMLGALYTRDMTKKYEEGLSLSEQYLTRTNSDQIKLMKAHFHAMLGQAESAQELLDELGNSISQSSFGLGVAARVRSQQGRFKDAESLAREAYRSRDSTKNLFLLISTLERQQKFDEAFEFIHRHTANNPESSVAKQLLAERLVNRDIDAAISQYEALLNISENNIAIMNNLALLYLKKGDKEPALLLAEKAISLMPSSSDITDTLAQIYISKAQPDKAIELYKKIEGSDDIKDEVMFNYIKLLVDEGEDISARRRLKSHNWRNETLKNELLLKL